MQENNERMNFRLHYLFERYTSNTCSEPEFQELLSLLKQEESFTDLQPLLLKAAAKANYHIQEELTNWSQMLENVLSPKSEQVTVQEIPRIHFLRTAWFRCAAVLLLMAGTATFLYLNHRPQKEIVQTTSTKKPVDIQPGGNKAILTLADGSTIILDSAANGSLAEQSGTKILKLDAGKLAYHAGNATGEVLYNTVSTPKGGQYQITLPDGTKVWLNAASSIRFPTIFINDRKVTITGEAYLEVAADKSRPFSVAANGTEVDILGTSFNVNAYMDEQAVKTSLLNGAVRIENAVLKPGQAFSEGRIISTDIEQDIAWKNGIFNFHGINIQQIMKQLERWYDIQIQYEGSLPEIHFKGQMDRGVKLSTVLSFLSDNGLHFKLEGRRLTVTNE